MNMDTEPTTRLHDAPLDAALTHEKMMAEARRIIDSGNERGVVLRLTAGLAVRHYATTPSTSSSPSVTSYQIVNLNEKDVHDVITPCKDVYVGFQPHPGVLDLEHVPETCAGDWGLYIDVMSSTDIVMERVDDHDLSPRQASRVWHTLELAQDMMNEHSKSLRWRLPSRIGKRLKWYKEMEEQFGGRSEDTALAVRTKAGRAAGGPGEARETDAR